MLHIKHIFIINPYSGKKKSALAFEPIIKQVATNLNIEYEIYHTTGQDHATKIVKDIAKTGAETRFYACGGDGTLNEVFYGAYKYNNAQVASIPCGSGNDYVRNFGSASDFRKLENNIKGSPVNVDLICVNDRICHDIASIGLDANVAFGMKKFKNLPLISGKLSYNLSIIQQVLKPLGQNLRITVDNHVFEGSYLMTAICNGTTYGSGILASKFSNLHDGLLEVIVVNKVSKLKIAAIISDYKKGNHIKNENEVSEDFKHIISMAKGQKIKVEKVDKTKMIANIDGECFVMDSFNAQVLPNAAKFVLPLNIYNEYVKNKGL